ncbi:MAG TPA: 30S ribosomal protein S16 [Candidatus Saccharibacteria bacterium]|nr:30S ribosomal protein S16 [Candidatus Saccharibacteria bacterium]HMT39410.1 30S ribosomal protein S16 [Candidatus Saccharibacteria bacterium]
MVVIRLARHGRHKYPTYRIVAADKRRAVTSKFLAILGTYNPHTKQVNLKKEEIQKYLDNGAQASDRVLRIFIKEGIDLPKWAKTHDRFKKTKKEVDESSEKADSSETTEETPEATDEVAQASTDKSQDKAEQIKNDVGTQKEAEDLKEQAEVTEKVADAVEKTLESQSKE